MHADIDTSIVHVYISVCTICTYGDPFYREIEIEVEIETKTNKQTTTRTHPKKAQTPENNSFCALDADRFPLNLTLILERLIQTSHQEGI